MRDEHKSPQRSRRVMRPYVAAWALLAVFALAYMALAVTRPDLLTLMIAADQKTDMSEKRELQIASQMSSDIQTLHKNVGQLQDEMVMVRSQLNDRSIREQDHESRIAALEKRTGDDVAAQAAAKSPEIKKQVSAASASTDGVASNVAGANVINAKATEPTGANSEGKTDPKSTDPQKTTTLAKNGTGDTKKSAAPPSSAAKKFETGSVKPDPAPVDFGPAIVTPAARPIGVRIATGPSVDSLRLSWSALSDRHRPTLQDLEPRYITGIDATGLTFDLMAGPIATAADADRICLRLKASGVRCIVGEFTGNSL